MCIGHSTLCSGTPWIVLLAMTMAIASVAGAADSRGRDVPDTASDWISLFNGKDLSGWKVVLKPDHKGIDPDSIFQVHDGAIHVYKDVPAGVAVPIGFIVTDDSYGSYHLRLDYRWVGKRFAPRTQRPRDAGILYHASAEPKVWPRSIECQIQEKDVGDCFTVNGAQVESTFDPKRLQAGEHQYLSAKDGGVAGVWGGPKIERIIKGSTHETDGWNTVDVILRGDEEVVHIVNGHEVFRAKNLRQLGDDGKTWAPLGSGRILLQGEYAEVQYRNIKIRPLAGRPFRINGERRPAPQDAAE